MKESTTEVQVETSYTTEMVTASGRMGIRKHPITYGKSTNAIKNQSEMSYEIDNSMNK